MYDTKQKHVEKLWREDLGGFYQNLLKIVSDGYVESLEDDVDAYSSLGNRYRQYKTAVLLGISLIPDRIFDIRYVVNRLLSKPSLAGYFSERNAVYEFLDMILCSQEGQNHLKNANAYLMNHIDTESWCDEKLIRGFRAASMRAAIKSRTIGMRDLKRLYINSPIAITW